ncbi:MAG: Rieske 2Fe-2S domain-containing protein [Streptosporangiaceae bacterium]
MTRSRWSPSDTVTSRLNPTRWWLGADWESSRFGQPGWLLLPLRLFLGVTFTFAALQKLSNPDFFNASSPVSVQQQMQTLAPSSPIGPLVRLSLHAGFLVGLLIALAELAIGVGTLLGLKARLAAVGGALLALTFFLTVSWNTTPYYYGADIVFLFAWTPFVALGAAGVLSLDSWIVQRGAVARGVGAPSPAQTRHERERRALLTAGALALMVGGFTAVMGRLLGGSSSAATRTAGLSPRQGSPTGHTRDARRRSRQQGSQAPSGMTAIGSANAVPVGAGGQFNDPGTGNPAWLIRPAKHEYAAFSAVCTHAGCTVSYQPSSNEFVCPCHGGVYSAKTGQVLGGPPPAPLAAIRVQVADGQIYVD